MLNPDYTYPGGGVFIEAVAAQEQDTTLVAQINKLEPVKVALSKLEGAAHVADGQVRDDLLMQASDQIRVLQAGISAILKGVDEVSKVTGGTVPATAQAASHAGLPMRDGVRPGVKTIQSGPIDADALGVSGSAKPDGWDERAAAEREAKIDRDGIDEGISGAIKRPDTGVNQSISQHNVPTQFDQSPVGPNSFEGNPDPPTGEPNNTDKGTGAALLQEGPNDGTGLTLASQKAALGDKPEPGDEEKPPEKDTAKAVKAARGKRKS